MKNLLIAFAALFISVSAFSQAADSADTRPVYLRFPTIPQFTVFKAPDSTAFTRDDLGKKKSTVFFIFSPDCGHCQHETQMMLNEIKKFRNTQIVMITYLPYEEMMSFYKLYTISKYPQITMARDTKYFFPVFYKVQNLPSIFVYDKKGNFTKNFEGDVQMDSIVEAL